MRLHENRGVVFTQAKITGKTQREVIQGLDEYLRAYPKQGYSTRIVKKPTQFTQELWEAEVSRYSNSD